ncbi:aminodeoxychorismate lyase [Lampropedia cohaerens]|uniref:Endolytic murein transglycosylase n=1 Tax=Lampropedia cohaerens TaxID=1610491 RepID=A0A0U1PYT5_9BURK|nr:endolytic transglycosylase MltG [Lampropedia cohaerens]KKW67680.1 aminodeoxychorismate lyase [Lampropedia cohaerens]
MIVLLALAAGAVLAYANWWRSQPLDLGDAPVELEIPRGSSARMVAQLLHSSGALPLPAPLTYAWLRATGAASQLKAGYYAFESGVTPQRIVDRIVRGEQSLEAMTIVEGWTFRQVRALLAQLPLRHDTAELSDAQIMARLGREGVHPEGRFFPDTYLFAKGSSDLALLRQAMEAMDRMLEAAWQQRARDTPLRSLDEALILASIIEKETGLDSERGRVAGVFINRLRLGMRLQTDPSVIYGVGEDFDGRLRRVHLDTDTPWNTYTRAGLPPTPIAMPGRASLLAAVQPEKTTALYFVARGDGSSEFSDTLQQHNRAVNRYIRGQQ